MQSLALFVTLIRRVVVADDALSADIAKTARMIARDDKLGRQWSKENSYPGYTSYGSLPDLPRHATCFAALKMALDREARAFAADVHFDLGRGRLKLDNMWINILEPGGIHSGHIHPYSAISGTCYARTPHGAASLKFEDPRHAMMMAAPPRLEDAPQEARTFVYIAPEEGVALFWESWLRHEVVRNEAKESRISISFNYRWA